VREFPHQSAFSNRSYWRNCDWVPICLTSSYKETKIKPALIGAAAVAAAAFATPALAQTIIEDPGYCAQFYPDANCQNLGPGNPYDDGGNYRNWQNGYAIMSHQAAEPDAYRYHGGPKSND